MSGGAHRGCGETGCGGIIPINKHMDVHSSVYVHVPIGIFKGGFQTLGLTSELSEVAEAEIEILPGDFYYN